MEIYKTSIRILLAENAERFQAGERVAMRRWLMSLSHRQNWYALYQSTEKLAFYVSKCGGDVEALCQKGRDRVVAMICKERGL